MAAEFDPYSIEQQNAERGAQVIQIDSSKHVSVIAWCAAICGVCLAGLVVCACIANWAITENRVTQSKFENLHSRVIALENNDAK